MQYLLHDLIKLPLNERLIIIEKMIESVHFTENETNSENFQALTHWQSQAFNLLSEKRN